MKLQVLLNSECLTKTVSSERSTKQTYKIFKYAHLKYIKLFYPSKIYSKRDIRIKFILYGL